MLNHKTQYVAPIEYLRMKTNKLMVSDAFTDQFYCNYFSHRTFGISLQVIFLDRHSIHQIRIEQVLQF